MKIGTDSIRENGRRSVLVALALAALIGGAPVRAQDTTGEIDKIFSWATPGTPGCACAVSLNGELVVNRAYGSADLERDAPITPGTIFDAGSLQKQFVAAAALLLVEEGRIALSDDVRKYVPELPDYGHTITIDHLLTHTSGLRDWTGLMQLSAGKEDALSLILRQRGLNFPPGEAFSYSNSGFVLAKEVVSRVSGMSFGEFARRRLFEPLGMKSTSYRQDMREVVKNRALAYDRKGDHWRMAMLLDDDRGGGGLLSTAADLIIWSDALANNRLGQFISQRMHEPARLNNGRALSYARGLFINTTSAGDTFYWHSGSADGYKSALARFPAHGLSIAIMCNSGDDTDRIAFVRRILDLFVPAVAAGRAEVQPLPAVADGVDVAGLDLTSMAGLFFSESTGEPLRVVVQGDRLRIAGGPPLVAASADRFRCGQTALSFMSEDEFELHFLSEDELDLKSMEGKTTRYRRAEPYAPAPDELKSFAGRYGNREVGTVLRVDPSSDGLVVRLEHVPDRALDFTPVDRDTFQWNRMTMRFQRDATGVIVGFNYSNPVLRNIRFTPFASDDH